MADYQLLQDRIYHDIRQKILSGELRPGIVYSETKMAAESGVSKTPVKAALLRLSQDHYIEIMPSRGFRLRELTKEDIWEMFHIRTAIEGYCASLLIDSLNTRNGTEAVLRLERCLSKEHELIKKLDSSPSNKELITSELENNVVFHQTLIEFSESDTMLKLFRSHCYSILKATSESYLTGPRLSDIYREHSSIVAAIKERDELLCAHLIRDHMSAARDRNLRIIEARNDE